MVARLPLPHPDAQTAFDEQIAVTKQAIWVADARGSYLVRVDVATNRITDVPIDPPLLAAGDAGLWMVSPWGGAPAPISVNVSRVDLLTGRPQVVATLPAGTRLAVGLGGVWVADGDIRLLDAISGEVIRTFANPGIGIEVACGALWSWDTSRDEQHPGDVLRRLDERSGKVLEQILLPNAVHWHLTEIDGLCWTTVGATLLGIQPGHGLVLTTSKGFRGGVQIAGNTVWSWTSDGLVQQVDPRTGQYAGPTWQLPEQNLHVDPKGASDWRLLSAGGSLWLLGADGIVRYQIATGE